MQGPTKPLRSWKDGVSRFAHGPFPLGPLCFPTHPNSPSPARHSMLQPDTKPQRPCSPPCLTASEAVHSNTGWRACIFFMANAYNLGVFPTEAEAIAAHDRANVRAHGAKAETTVKPASLYSFEQAQHACFVARHTVCMPFQLPSLQHARTPPPSTKLQSSGHLEAQYAQFAIAWVLCCSPWHCARKLPPMTSGGTLRPASYAHRLRNPREWGKFFGERPRPT
jgi:hypothetical protein